MEKPNYYAILTATVRYDKRLCPNAKLLYAEITALSNMNGRCTATNRYFANLFAVSTTSISKWISQLSQFGYIYTKIEYKEGSKEIADRYITILKEGTQEKLNTPHQEKLKDNINALHSSNINATHSNNTQQEDFCRVFELFWDTYPRQRRGDKQNSRRCFQNALKRDHGDTVVTAELILDACKKYALSGQVSRGFASSCEAWLNQSKFLYDWSIETNNGPVGNVQKTFSEVMEAIENKHRGRECKIESETKKLLPD